MNWLYGAPLVAALLHITEEFFLPGGFAAWDRRYRPDFARSINSRFHILMNGLLLIAAYDTYAMRDRPIGPLLFLTVAALLFSNALWHLRGAWKTRSYSPGMVTGTLLYIPLALVGYFHLIHSGAASIGIALLAFAIGGSYPLVSTFLHRRRTRAAGRG